MKYNENWQHNGVKIVRPYQYCELWYTSVPVRHIENRFRMNRTGTQ